MSITLKRPFFIAECGVNHEGSLDKAHALIDSAYESGASAVKFQSYKASSLASVNSPSYWDLSSESTDNQHTLFSKYDSFEQQEYLELFKHCDQLGIEFMSTPFDLLSLEYLTPLVKRFKLASADLTTFPFLKAVASKNKPVLLSTGASTHQEINQAIEHLCPLQPHEITLLHCVLSYPTVSTNASLGYISFLKENFLTHPIGYSDHTLPHDTHLPLISSWLLGASVIEKHFTLDKSLPGNDHYHSYDGADLASFIKTIDSVIELYDSPTSRIPLPCEYPARIHARRSVVLTEDIKKGEFLTSSHLTFKRPGSGISTFYINYLVGKKVKSDLSSDTILSWDHIDLS